MFHVKHLQDENKVNLLILLDLCCFGRKVRLLKFPDERSHYKKNLYRQKCNK